jgi:hypothetical protein
MRIGRVHPGDLISAISGGLLLFVMELDWFREHTFAGASAEPQFALNAWETFDVGDIILAVVAVIAMAMLVVAILSPAAAVGMSFLVALAGAVALGAILVRLVAQPGANEMVDVDTGVWLALLCALGIGFGGWLAMKSERRPGSEAGADSAMGATAR